MIEILYMDWNALILINFIRFERQKDKISETQ